MSGTDSLMTKEARISADTWSWIRKHGIFQGITNEEVISILPFFGIQSLKPGEYLIVQGPEVTTDLYLVLDGQLEVLKADGGRE